MITPAHARLMARYNRWQNESVYGAADGLTDAVRKADRGAYFGSIHGTLSHLAFGDQSWMFRFTRDPVFMPAATSIVASATAIPDWSTLKQLRTALDHQIITWADRLSPEDLAGDVVYYSVAFGREFRKPTWELVTHMYNHQTHHRGQVHCLLTQAGAAPGDTDLPMLPEMLR